MNYHIAQINVAKMKGVNIDDPIMIDFKNQLDTINALAEESKGFVWRLKDEETNDATSLNPYGDEQMIVNLSVWESIEDLKNFTYKTLHVEVFKRKKEWFTKMTSPHLVLWFIPEGELPTAEEGIKRLAHLEEHGETPHAFTFKSKFDSTK